MLKKLCVLVFLGIIGLIFSPCWVKPSSAQDDMAAYQNNGCVNCHSKDTMARAAFTRYTEWHISTHKEKGVGCEKCHGGDAATKDKGKAHAGVIKPSEAQSRLHPKNLPETCKTCHPNIVNSFVESKHYQKLQASGMGPSCTTCHEHMASVVLYTPEETASLCAHCHNTVNGLLPRRPEIPQAANETMQAIRRANTVVLWADRLVEQGQNKKIDVSEEQNEMKIVRAMLAEAKASWHAFNLDVVRKKADAAFDAGTKVKDELMKKLHPQQVSE